MKTVTGMIGIIGLLSVLVAFAAPLTQGSVPPEPMLQTSVQA